MSQIARTGIPVLTGLAPNRPILATHPLIRAARLFAVGIIRWTRAVEHYRVERTLRQRELAELRHENSRTLAELDRRRGALKSDLRFRGVV